MKGDVFGQNEDTRYGAVIRKNGVRHIYAQAKEGALPVGHQDPDLLRWMGQNGHSCIEEIPVIRDDRPPTTCERCGARGVETHHWAPREWFGKREADLWPTAELCRTCHQIWHWAAERAAARLTVRILRGKGLHRIADNIEAALDHEDLESIA